MTTSQTEPPMRRVITSDEALRIARLDGEKAYRDDLSSFRIALVLEPDGWHVDHELKDPNWCGGDPRYIINASNGRILWKIYDR